MLSGKSTKVLFNALENYHYEILNISSLSQKYEPDRSFNKYLWGTYHRPCPVLYRGATDPSACSLEAICKPPPFSAQISMLSHAHLDIFFHIDVESH